ncbi:MULTISPECIES: hypothetical protein [unclassified Actinoplanes]|nr:MULTISPECIES: hypothetical protein [unclassified Actinoplanes]
MIDLDGFQAVTRHLRPGVRGRTAVGRKARGRALFARGSAAGMDMFMIFD